MRSAGAWGVEPANWCERLGGDKRNACHVQKLQSVAVLPLTVSSETILGLYGSGVCSSGKNARQSFLRYHSSCDVEQLAAVDLLGACHGLSEPNAYCRLVVRGAGNASLLQIGRHRAARQPLACPASANCSEVQPIVMAKREREVCDKFSGLLFLSHCVTWNRRLAKSVRLLSKSLRHHLRWLMIVSRAWDLSLSWLVPYRGSSVLWTCTSSCTSRQVQKLRLQDDKIAGIWGFVRKPLTSRREIYHPSSWN